MLISCNGKVVVNSILDYLGCECDSDTFNWYVEEFEKIKVKDAPHVIEWVLSVNDSWKWQLMNQWLPFGSGSVPKVE